MPIRASAHLPGERPRMSRPIAIDESSGSPCNEPGRAQTGVLLRWSPSHTRPSGVTHEQASSEVGVRDRRVHGTRGIRRRAVRSGQESAHLPGQRARQRRPHRHLPAPPRCHDRWARPQLRHHRCQHQRRCVALRGQCLAEVGQRPRNDGGDARDGAQRRAGLPGQRRFPSGADRRRDTRNRVPADRCAGRVGRRTGLQPAASNSPTARCSTPRRSRTPPVCTTRLPDSTRRRAPSTFASRTASPMASG